MSKAKVIETTKKKVRVEMSLDDAAIVRDLLQCLKYDPPFVGNDLYCSLARLTELRPDIVKFEAICSGSHDLIRLRIK